MTTARDTHNQIEYAKEIAHEEELEEGLAKGRVIGRAEGLEEGLVKGREEGRVEGREEGRAEDVVEAYIVRTRNNKSRSTCFSWELLTKSWRRRPACPWRRLLS